MDFKQLEAFVHVVQHASFSRAAEEIFVSQPSVSAYIGALEKELGTQLLFRSTKEVFPTQAGRILYEHAKNILTMRDTAIFDIRNLSENPGGEIAILSSSAPAQYILPRVLTAFGARYPRATFRITQTDSEAVIRGITGQTYELGVTGTLDDEAKCVFRTLASDRLVIIAPPGFRAPPGDIAALLRSQPFVMREEGSGTRREFLKYLHSIGVRVEDVHCVARLNNTQAVIQAVAAGLGVSVVSRIAADNASSLGLVRSIDIDAPELHRDFYFVHRRDFQLSPIASLFMEFAIGFMKNEQKS